MAALPLLSRRQSWPPSVCTVPTPGVRVGGFVHGADRNYTESGARGHRQRCSRSRGPDESRTCLEREPAPPPTARRTQRCKSYRALGPFTPPPLARHDRHNVWVGEPGQSPVCLGGAVPELRLVPRHVVAQGSTAAVVVLTLLLMGIPVAPARGALQDVGFEGPSYLGTARPASAEKPQSKLWYGHGSWWAVMWARASADWRIFRLNRARNEWLNTGVLVDRRRTTLADALFDARTGKLYIASHVASKGVSFSGNPALLMRYSYVRGTWMVDPGFPSRIMSYSSESMTIDKDSVGNVWATWTQVAPGRTNGAVYVARGARGGALWGRPFLVPSADVGGNLPRPDDISTVVSFDRKIGVMWSNQAKSAFYWSVHSDGASDSTWTKGTAFRRPEIADDHINLKSLLSDKAGRVYAVFKTDYNESSQDKRRPQVILGTYPVGGGWTGRTVWTIGDCVTRPLVMVDRSTRRLYAMATAPQTGCRYSGQRGVIFQKTASLANPTFSSGRGKIIMKDADSLDLSNVTGSKHSVDDRSGLVLLATNSSTKRYWHSDSKAGS